MMSSQTRKTTRKSAPTTTPLASSPAKITRSSTTKTAPRALAPGLAGEGGEDQVEIRIPADARWVRMVRLAVAGVASVLNFSIDEIDDIKSAVAEACNNAILHGQPAHQSEQLPTVVVTMIPTRDYLEIRVEDQGRLSDGITIPAPKSQNMTGHSGALPVGGLGLLFIETMMDEVRLLSGPDTNTTVIMVKKRPSLG